MSRVATAGFTQYLSVPTVLDAVEQWAEWFELLRETGALRCGRLDGVLVPDSWNARTPPGLIGVEVKLSRSDFLCGLKKEQYTRYESHVNALYVATPRGICKTSEIPTSCGHLVCTERHGYGLVCVCKRKPKWRDAEIDHETLWRVIWDLFDQKNRNVRKMREELDQQIERCCNRASYAMSRLLRKDDP